MGRCDTVYAGRQQMCLIPRAPCVPLARVEAAWICADPSQPDCARVGQLLQSHGLAASNRPASVDEDPGAMRAAPRSSRPTRSSAWAPPFQCPGRAGDWIVMTFAMRLSAIAVVSVLLLGTPASDAAAAPRKISSASTAGIRVPSGTPDARPFHPRTTPTTTTLAVTPSTGPAFRAVTISLKVAGTADAHRTVRGAVTVRDGVGLLARNVTLVAGLATVTTNALGPGPHQIKAEFTGTARASRSVSNPVLATFDGAASADGTVVVTIPSGSLTITSAAPRATHDGDSERSPELRAAFTRLRATDVVITDTRAGNLGFTASAVAGPIVDGSGREYAGSHAGLVHLDAEQVPGNALRARDVRVRDIRPGSPGLGEPRNFARYPAEMSTGSARVHGDLVVTGVRAQPRGERLRTMLTFTVM